MPDNGGDARVVELLEKIVMASCPMGTDSGNLTVERLASEALAILKTSTHSDGGRAGTDYLHSRTTKGRQLEISAMREGL